MSSHCSDEPIIIDDSATGFVFTYQNTLKVMIRYSFLLPVIVLPVSTRHLLVQHVHALMKISTQETQHMATDSPAMSVSRASICALVACSWAACESSLCIRASWASSCCRNSLTSYDNVKPGSFAVADICWRVADNDSSTPSKLATNCTHTHVLSLTAGYQWLGGLVVWASDLWLLITGSQTCASVTKQYWYRPKGGDALQLGRQTAVSVETNASLPLGLWLRTSPVSWLPRDRDQLLTLYSDPLPTSRQWYFQ